VDVIFKTALRAKQRHDGGHARFNTRSSLVTPTMQAPSPIQKLPKVFLALTALYFLTSFGHFSHNAEFICEYPNLPASFTRAKVYVAWLGITAIGALGFYWLGKRFVTAGLVLVAVYAALGFDGLAHYKLAPMAFHTLGANVSILSEVVAAALLLPTTLYLLMIHWRPGGLAKAAGGRADV
jgi:hypothetical protein